MLRGGVADVLAPSMDDVRVGDVDETSDSLAGEIPDVVPTSFGNGCGFAFVYVSWVHEIDAMR